MEYLPGGELDVELAVVARQPGGDADGGEYIRHEVAERFAPAQPTAEFVRLAEEPLLGRQRDEPQVLRQGDELVGGELVGVGPGRLAGEAAVLLVEPLADDVDLLAHDVHAGADQPLVPAAAQELHE